MPIETITGLEFPVINNRQWRIVLCGVYFYTRGPPPLGQDAVG